MEALSGTCTLWVTGRRGLRHVVCDAVVAVTVVLLPAVTRMCQVGGLGSGIQWAGWLPVVSLTMCLAAH